MWKKKKKGNTSQTKSISNSENILGIECVVNLSVVISTMKYLGIEMFLFSFLSDVNLLFLVLQATVRDLQVTIHYRSK